MKQSYGDALFACLAVEPRRMLCPVEEVGVQVEGKQRDGVEGGGVSKGT